MDARRGRDNKDYVRREDGFNTYFGGANRDRADEKNKQERDRSKSRGGSTTQKQHVWANRQQANSTNPYKPSRYADELEEIRESIVGLGQNGRADLKASLAGWGDDKGNELMQKVIKMIKAKVNDEEFMHDLGRFVLGSESLERDNKSNSSTTKIRIGSAKTNGVVLTDDLDKKVESKGKWGLRKELNVHHSKEQLKTKVSQDKQDLYNQNSSHNSLSNVTTPEDLNFQFLEVMPENRNQASNPTSFAKTSTQVVNVQKPSIQAPPKTQYFGDSLFESNLNGMDQTIQDDVRAKQMFTNVLAKPTVKQEALEDSDNEGLDIQANNLVTLRIKSTHSGVIGLKTIRLFDKTGQEIYLKPDNLHCQLARHLHALVEDESVNGQQFSMDFPLLASFIDIKIKYFGSDAGSIFIANSITDGCHELEFIVNGASLLEVKLKPQECQTFPLCKGARLPNLTHPQVI